ncbi:hypothetical protein SYNPS1DRAFT_26340 [Syncephalis pseudoplumigaleata]|uniref:Uncharacterized protein n=1 Tax=Syncephalis pseudoplumigaleata TaxID=1712513 RepID=A0A4P9Z5Y7_9FUNG|nr:hypothetical protein SYNPS1DRAFT_26340 [Syncephalis pseudoplumigaleata]|eukprot:RKP28063.1 hypothetical protein SYNPS1DRAFT_26340 [Syncephalis pseudoplumigaleata]
MPGDPPLSTYAELSSSAASTGAASPLSNRTGGAGASGRNYSRARTSVVAPLPVDIPSKRMETKQPTLVASGPVWGKPVLSTATTATSISSNNSSGSGTHVGDGHGDGSGSGHNDDSDSCTQPSAVWRPKAAKNNARASDTLAGSGRGMAMANDNEYPTAAEASKTDAKCKLSIALKGMHGSPCSGHPREKPVIDEKWDEMSDNGMDFNEDVIEFADGKVKIGGMLAAARVSANASPARSDTGGEGMDARKRRILRTTSHHDRDTMAPTSNDSKRAEIAKAAEHPASAASAASSSSVKAAGSDGDAAQAATVKSSSYPERTSTTWRRHAASVTDDDEAASSSCKEEVDAPASAAASSCGSAVERPKLSQGDRTSLAMERARQRREEEERERLAREKRLAEKLRMLEEQEKQKSSNNSSSSSTAHASSDTKEPASSSNAATLAGAASTRPHAGGQHRETRPTINTAVNGTHECSSSSSSNTLHLDDTPRSPVSLASVATSWRRSTATTATATASPASGEATVEATKPPSTITSTTSTTHATSTKLTKSSVPSSPSTVHRASPRLSQTATGKAADARTTSSTEAAQEVPPSSKPAPQPYRPPALRRALQQQQQEKQVDNASSPARPATPTSTETHVVADAGASSLSATIHVVQEAEAEAADGEAAVIASEGEAVVDVAYDAESGTFEGNDQEEQEEDVLDHAYDDHVEASFEEEEENEVDEVEDEPAGIDGLPLEHDDTAHDVSIVNEDEEDDDEEDDDAGVHTVDSEVAATTVDVEGSTAVRKCRRGRRGRKRGDKDKAATIELDEHTSSSCTTDTTILVATSHTMTMMMSPEVEYSHADETEGDATTMVPSDYGEQGGWYHDELIAHSEEDVHPTTVTEDPSMFCVDVSLAMSTKPPLDTMAMQHHHHHHHHHHGELLQSHSHGSTITDVESSIGRGHTEGELSGLLTPPVEMLSLTPSDPSGCSTSLSELSSTSSPSYVSIQPIAPMHYQQVPPPPPPPQAASHHAMMNTAYVTPGATIYPHPVYAYAPAPLSMPVQMPVHSMRPPNSGGGGGGGASRAQQLHSNGGNAPRPLNPHYAFHSQHDPSLVQSSQPQARAVATALPSQFIYYQMPSTTVMGSPRTVSGHPHGGADPMAAMATYTIPANAGAAHPHGGPWTMAAAATGHHQHHQHQQHHHHLLQAQVSTSAAATSATGTTFIPMAGAVSSATGTSMSSGSFVPMGSHLAYGSTAATGSNGGSSGNGGGSSNNNNGNNGGAMSFAATATGGAHLPMATSHGHAHPTIMTTTTNWMVQAPATSMAGSSTASSTPTALAPMHVESDE